MKKKWLKKGSTVLLAVTMVLSLFPGMNGTVVTAQAADNNAPTSGYWTDVAGLKSNYNLNDGTIGKIRFGASDRLWAICGEDEDGSLALLSTSEFTRSVYGNTSDYSKSSFVRNINTYLGTTYFSTGETGKMKDVTIAVSTNESTESVGDQPVPVEDKKLYLPNSEDQNSYGQKTIYVGSNNNIAIDVTKLDDVGLTNIFWLRSPIGSSSDNAFVADPGKIVNRTNVFDSDVSVVPAFNLNLSSDIFASAADAASSSYSGYKANSSMIENTYTLRYPSASNDGVNAVISVDATKVTVTGANGKYLMVQNNAGVYAMAIDSNSKTVDASDITMDSVLENFNNCKVWIESTTDRITTAKLATQTPATVIESIAVTDITTPEAGTVLDTGAACASTRVTSKTPAVVWTPNDITAAYNTTYTASVTLTADDAYEFAAGVTATVNGVTASATKNQNGTLTVSYSYKTASKAVSNEYFATVDDLKECYNISAGTIGKIRFGENNRHWAICGADGDGSLALLSTSEFVRAAYGKTCGYSKSNFVQNINTYLGTAYFSPGETGKMKAVTVVTNETTGSVEDLPVPVEDMKLYLPNSENQNSYGQKTIYVGSSNNIDIDVTKLNDVGLTNLFWLRSPYVHISNSALVVDRGFCVHYDLVDDTYVSVVPAFNLNLSSVLFASAANAASSSYSGYKANSSMIKNTFTLRYPSVETENAVISASGKKVTVTNANNKYLMVQNSTGVYTMPIDSNNKTVNASDIQMGSNETDKLDNFNNCKVWIESTDIDRITTAKMATQATAIDSVAVTDITAPEGGSALDTQAVCETVGVTSTTPTVVWTPNDTIADYNTTYTASVTLTADDYEFAAGVTVNVNGQSATSVTKNQDGTVTATYEFPATAKAKLTSITAPAGIIVANGTAYAAMGFPTTVAIVTEGNAVTTAVVEWNTITPASGSYNPAVLTEQSVTLNGTVTCPTNIDQNGVTLTTTITVTISAAGIVGTPAFAPVAGTYTENQSVVLTSSTDGATIYYTTNGTTPTTDSDVYSGAISVTGIAGQSKSTTIKAIAVKSGMQTSSVASATYFIEIPVPAPSTYAVTVNNGTGDGSYVAGETVTITADTAPSGQEFDSWTVISGGVIPANAASSTTTFEMPANAVEVTATYKNVTPPGTYAVTVNNGTGDGNYAAGATVTITADTAPSGQEFDSWIVVSGGVALASATSSTTTFIMPANAVEVTATYKNVISDAKKDIAKAAISGVSNKNYTGKSLTQSKLVVKIGNTTLKKNTDYTVSYNNNKNIGTATITVKGKGNYTGTANKTFKITISKGKTYTVGSMKYKVTNASTNGKGTVTLTKTTKKKTNKKFTNYSMEKTVNIGGKTFEIIAISDKAFKGYTKLEKVTIGANVTSIGKEAFSGCKAIKTITIKSKKLTKVGKNAIKNIYKKTTIKVPSSKRTAYKNLFKSSTGFMKSMTIKK